MVCLPKTVFEFAGRLTRWWPWFPDATVAQVKPPPSEVAERLDELAELAEACRSAFLKVSTQSHWRPAGGSAAEQYQNNITDPAVSDHIRAGYDLVSEVVVTYLEVAAGHFGGLAALFRRREVMFAPLPLVRSIIEHAAHTIWVLGDGKGAANDAVARAYLEEFVSWEFAKEAAGRMGSKTSTDYKDAVKRWKTIRDRAIAAFPGTTPTDLGKRTLGGQSLPGPEEAVRQMFVFINREAGGTVDDRQARGIYSFLCSGTHPSTYQAQQLRVPVDHGDHAGSILQMDVEFLEKVLALAVVAFYNALGYTMAFLGADNAPHDVLTEKVVDVLPTVMK
ncbi:DinB family protein [Williamsia muralis]|uniref:DinB family protein n=1 Tax=Williamsia marianensis TaxID=85044 RepID=UPI0010578D93|nr:DinB family protein [Williamsia marianensis]